MKTSSAVGLLGLLIAFLFAANSVIDLASSLKDLRKENTELREKIRSYIDKPAQEKSDLSAQCVVWWMGSNIEQARKRICTETVKNAIHQ